MAGEIKGDIEAAVQQLICDLKGCEHNNAAILRRWDEARGNDRIIQTRRGSCRRCEFRAAQVAVLRMEANDRRKRLEDMVDATTLTDRAVAQRASEIARLRAEVAHLRACVGGDRPVTQERMEAAIQAAVEAMGRGRA